MLSVKEYLNEIRQYLKDMIKDHKTQGEWKIQSTIAISFMSKILMKVVLYLLKVIT